MHLPGKVVIPSGYVWMQPLLLINKSGVNGNYSLWSKPIIRRAVNAELIADGAITANAIAANTITTAMLKAGSITTDKLTVGGVTYNNIAPGSIARSTVQQSFSGAAGTLGNIFGPLNVDNANGSSVTFNFSITFSVNPGGGGGGGGGADGYVQLLNTADNRVVFRLNMHAPGTATVTQTWDYRVAIEDQTSGGLKQYYVQGGGVDSVSGNIRASWAYR